MIATIYVAIDTSCVLVFVVGIVALVAILCRWRL